MKLNKLLCMALLLLIPTLGVAAAPNYLAVHFLDIGQADCTLIKSPSGETMLIDAGNKVLAESIVKYLSKQGIKKIDILIGTNPAEAYTGSMAAVISNFEIGQFYISKAPNFLKELKELQTAIKSKKLKIHLLEPGTPLNLGLTLNLEVLAPNAVKYTEINDYSPVIKLTYNKTSFLFTGTAGRQCETELLTNVVPLKADILKISQHGSNAASTAKFLAEVAPKYAIISVAKGQADFPHPVLLERLNATKVKHIYRTDQNGNVIVSSDGEKLQITTVPLGGFL